MRYKRTKISFIKRNKKLAKCGRKSYSLTDDEKIRIEQLLELEVGESGPLKFLSTMEQEIIEINKKLQGLQKFTDKVDMEEETQDSHENVKMKKQFDRLKQVQILLDDEKFLVN